MGDYLRLFRAIRSSEHAVAESADSAGSPQSDPNRTNCTGVSAENRMVAASPDRVVLYVDFAQRGAAAYARWLEMTEAGEGAL